MTKAVKARSTLTKWMRSETLTIEDVLCKSSDYLARHRVTNFKTDAEWLIAHSLGWQRMELYLTFNEVLSANSLKFYKKINYAKGKTGAITAYFRFCTICGANIKM